MSMKKYRIWRVLLVLYLLLIIRMIIFKYPPEELKAIMAGWRAGVIWEGLGSANFTPFRTITMYIRYYDRLNSFENLFGNVMAFVPCGILYPLAFPGKRNFWLFLSAVLLFVSGIELFQLFSAFGAFDIDDILLNCLGATFGYGCMILCAKISECIAKSEAVGYNK